MIYSLFQRLLKQSPRKLFVLIYNIPRMLIKKCFHPSKFHASLIQNISPSTEIACEGGIMILHHSIFTRNNVSFRVNTGGNLEIGTSFFNANCSIMCMKKVSIGDNCLFGPNVVVVDDDHDYKSPGLLRGCNFLTDEIIIGNNVWIGANVVVLRGTYIGDNCVVGAGCIVKGKYEEDTVITLQNREVKTKKILYRAKGEFSERNKIEE